MPTTHEATRGAAHSRTEVLRMLKDDHRKAKKAFQAFDKLDPAQDAEACRALVAKICAELTLHVVLEEELFYPAIRDALRDPGLIDVAEVEHAGAKTLIANLAQLVPGERSHAATFKVLGDTVRHHAEQEETEVFPQLARAKLDWDALHDAMMLRRDSLRQELLPQSEENADAAGRAEAQAFSREQDDRRRVAAQSAANEDA